MNNFYSMLLGKWEQKKFVCVGLDTDVAKFPNYFDERGIYLPREKILMYNCDLIDATHRYVCAYKPNLAFYLSLGGAGVKALERTILYIKKVDESIPVILDAKWADIGNTNDNYVKFLQRCGADAVTLQPYLGQEALKPFLDLEDKGCIILCRTSNKGADEFQDLEVNGTPLYLYVANNVVQYWNENENCALVVGATQPEELAMVRKQITRDMPILIPGIGKQGGDLEATVKAGVNSKKQGIIINSSRGIIFSSNTQDFQVGAEEKTLKLSRDIDSILNEM